MTEKGKEIIIDLDAEVVVPFNNVDVTENVISSTEENVVGDGVIVPAVGMKFKNETELFDFYKRYAYDVGFPVRKRNSKKGEDGVVNYLLIRPAVHLGSQSRMSHDTGSGTVQDPKCSKRKGAPRKLRQKSLLESHSTKRKANTTSRKGNRTKLQKSNLRDDVSVVQAQVPMSTPLSFSQLLLGAHESEVVTHSFPCTNEVPMSSTHVAVNFQGNATPYYYPHVAYEDGTNLGFVDASQQPAADDDVSF